MADDLEKTEEPTQKKIDDAKKEGNVPNSRDLTGLITLFVAVLCFFLILPFLYEQTLKTFHYILAFTKKPLDKTHIIDIFVNISFRIGIMVLILAIPVAIAGIIGNLSQFGFILSTKPINPELEKISPIKGFKNLISLKKFIESIKITFKSFISLGIGFLLFIIFSKELVTVSLFNIFDQLKWLMDKALIIVLVMLFITFVFSIADLFIVRYQYFSNLKMSKHEVKEEHKSLEGDPQIKAKIRQIQLETSKKRMMNEVPKADVVITNPTHYAVALEYDEKAKLPIVKAKGVDHLAIQIKRIARENGVQIYEDPPLARALYKDVELDEAVPQKLWEAVAKVLSFVASIDKRKKWAKNL